MQKNKALHSSPEAVDHAFYDALEHADLDAFMELWSDDEDIVCVPPNGPRLVGHHAIRDAWGQIFSNGPIHARPSQFHIAQGATMSVHNVIVQVIVNELGQTRVAHLNVTNIFLKGSQGWRLILHHSSPAPNETGGSTTASDSPPNILH